MRQEGKDPNNRPGRWIDLSDPAVHERLIALARRKLVGFEHLAEDAVARAVERWKRLSPGLEGIARIETVVRSEALSLLRSTQRARARDARATEDRSLPSGPVSADQLIREQKLIELWAALKQTALREEIIIEPTDREVLTMLFVGYSIADIVEVTTLSRYEVRKARAKWRRLAVLVLTDVELA